MRYMRSVGALVLTCVLAAILVVVIHHYVGDVARMVRRRSIGGLAVNVSETTSDLRISPRVIDVQPSQAAAAPSTQSLLQPQHTLPEGTQPHKEDSLQAQMLATGSVFTWLMTPLTYDAANSERVPKKPVLVLSAYLLQPLSSTRLSANVTNNNAASVRPKLKRKKPLTTDWDWTRHWHDANAALEHEYQSVLDRIGLAPELAFVINVPVEEEILGFFRHEYAVRAATPVRVNISQVALGGMRCWFNFIGEHMRGAAVCTIRCPLHADEMRLLQSHPPGNLVANLRLNLTVFGRITNNSNKRPAWTRSGYTFSAEASDVSVTALPSTYSHVKWMHCGSPLYGKTLASAVWLPTYLEYHLDVLGVGRMMLYLRSWNDMDNAHPQTKQEIMRRLVQRQLMITVMSPVPYEIRFWNQMSCFQDCLLRSTALSTYIMNTDMDEIYIPFSYQTEIKNSSALAAQAASNRSLWTLNVTEALLEKAASRLCGLKHTNVFMFTPAGEKPLPLSKEHPFRERMMIPPVLEGSPKRSKFTAIARDVLQINNHYAVCLRSKTMVLSDPAHPVLHYRGPPQRPDVVMDVLMWPRATFGQIVPMALNFPLLRTLNQSYSQ